MSLLPKQWKARIEKGLAGLLTGKGATKYEDRERYEQIIKSIDELTK